MFVRKNPIGFSRGSGQLLVAIAGAATIGAQNIVQAYVSQYYPPYIRSTALGVASGIGRMGGMIGPLLGGFLLSIALPIQMNFLAFAVPGVLAAIALSLVPNKRSYMHLQNQTIQIEEVRKTL